MAGLDQELDTDPRQREWAGGRALAPPATGSDRSGRRTGRSIGPAILAAMARNGFDYETARKVIDAVDADALDEVS
jgi:hypothetical protein